MIYLVGLMESCYFCVLIYKSGDKMKQAVWLAAVLILLLPLGRIHSKERSERENNTLRIMSYNIRSGRGMDNVADFRRTAEVINKVCPDVVAVQEIDSVTGRSGGKDASYVRSGNRL